MKVTETISTNITSVSLVLHEFALFEFVERTAMYNPLSSKIFSWLKNLYDISIKIYPTVQILMSKDLIL